MRTPQLPSASNNPHGASLRNPREACGCAAAHEGRAFYVSVKDGPRTGYLLGPYNTHEEALDNVDRGEKLAKQADGWADFYAFGTCSVPVDAPTIRTVFGN